jgi:hypothetical protein
MKPVSAADVQLIAIACCGLFLIGVYVGVKLSEIGKNLNKIVQMLESKS